MGHKKLRHELNSIPLAEDYTEIISDSNPQALINLVNFIEDKTFKTKESMENLKKCDKYKILLSKCER
jgi:hypothetical protein